MPDVTITIKTINEGDEGNRRAVGSFTELNSAISLVRQGLEVAQKAYSATAGKTLEYANQVRSLSMISGESAENTSRFIQVLDDYKIGADDALTATRALTKNGLAPNIDTLAKLSDEYLKLNSTEEKNAFVMKNLGRSGLQWIEVLNKGSTALRQQGDAVSAGLILNQKQLDQARELEIAQDVLAESWEKVALAIGNAAIPAMTQATDEFNNTLRAIEIMKEQGLNPLTEMLTNGDGYINALKQANEETLAQRDAMLQNAEAADQNTASLADAKAAMEANTAANNSFIGTLQNVASARETFTEGMAEVNAALADGSISVDEHSAKVAQLKGTYEETINAMVLGLIQFQLAADGAFDTEDLNTYLAAGVKLGQFTQGMVTETKKLYNEALNMSSGLEQAGDIIYHTGKRAVDAGEDLGVMADSAIGLQDAVRPATAAVGGLKSQLNGMPPSGTGWTYDFVINVSGQVPRIATATHSTAAGYNTNVHAGDDSGRDAGGPGLDNKAYMIGKGAQPEMFVPQSAGQFYPADQWMGGSSREVVEAIQAARIDPRELARHIVTALDQRGV
jgi:hypothetical protein